MKVRLKRRPASIKAVAFDSGVLGDCGTDPALLQQRLEASDQGSENVFSGHRALRTSHQMDQRRDIKRGAMDGAFFETWVVSEIYKNYLNQWKISAAAVFLP